MILSETDPVKVAGVTRTVAVSLSGSNVRDRVSVLQLLESAKEWDLNLGTISKYLVRHAVPALTIMR